jgi:hypothetical protein
LQEWSLTNHIIGWRRSALKISMTNGIKIQWRWAV